MVNILETISGYAKNSMKDLAKDPINYTKDIGKDLISSYDTLCAIAGGYLMQPTSAESFFQFNLEGLIIAGVPTIYRAIDEMDFKRIERNFFLTFGGFFFNKGLINESYLIMGSGAVLMAFGNIYHKDSNHPDRLEYTGYPF